MALFKLRKKVDEPKAPSSPAESIEAMRRRARHRLIGAVVLVLVGVIGFPLLFDTQPRPVAVDIPIEIPDRNKVKPLPPPAAPAATGKVSVPPPAPTPVVTESRQEAGLATPQKAEPEPRASAPAVAAAPTPAPKPAPAPKPEAPTPKLAKLESAPDEAAAAAMRYVVQVGAFAEKDKARLAQQKLDRAGLKNYTNVAETKNGPRIRVRAGPFASRAEADRAAQKIKGLDLPAAILSL